METFSIVCQSLNIDEPYHKRKGMVDNGYGSDNNVYATKYVDRLMEKLYVKCRNVDGAVSDACRQSIST